MFRIILNSIFFLLKLLGFIVGLLILIFIIKYINCPVYNLPPRTSFEGDAWFNPYASIKPDAWRKGNFQVQSRAWAGITSGRGNSNEEIEAAYESLGYDIIATSDYQKINRAREGKTGFIPVYEHGYGIQKTHQVLIGARKVLWKDYPFFQTRHNKQHILNLLALENEQVFLAHPLLRAGYSIEDMQVLTGYDGIEVLNNYRFSIEHWDAALSAGRYATILGNDDAHDIGNPDEIGHHCTFINTSSLDEKAILDAFQNGRTYGARIWRPLGETMDDKIRRTRILPELTLHTIRNDSLFVRTDSVVRFIRFMGQGGKELHRVEKTDRAVYAMQDSDSYVRVEIHFWNESSLYLNPVCRNHENKRPEMPIATVHKGRTWMLRIVGYATLLFIGINTVVFRRRMRRKKGT
jgi:hypothetical protein